MVVLWCNEPEVPVTTIIDVPAGVPSGADGGVFVVALPQETQKRVSTMALP